MKNVSAKRQEIIKSVVSYAEKTLDGEKEQSFIGFLEEYYHNFSFEDIQNKSEENLFGAAISHWRLAQKKQPRQKKVDVFNPNIEHYGWESSHTVIHLVTDDMPFMVDSIKMELTRLGCNLHVIANLAGVVVNRDASGNIKKINAKQGSKEAFLVFFVSKLSEKEELEEVKNAVCSVVDDVEICVSDWQAMKDSMQQSIDEITQLKSGFDSDDVDETKKFLEWLLEYFTFMGCRQYDTKGSGNKKGLYLVQGSSLGVLRDDSNSKVTRLYSELPPDTQKMALSKQILMISKTNTQSTIHRAVYTDVIGIKRFDNSGKVIGEKRFIGLFTSDAYDSDPSKIPILRKKVRDVINLSGFEHNIHSYKRLLHILKNLPRDELFQISPTDLCSMALGILEIQDKRKIKLFVRRDIFNRFVSCLVYIPRDNFNTELRIQVQDILLEEFNGLEVTATPSFSESPLARVHFIIRIDSQDFKDYDYEQIEQKIIKIARSWKDELLEKLLDKYGDHDGIKYYNMYARAFSAGYRDTYAPAIGASDLNYINNLSNVSDLEISVYRPATVSSNCLAIKIFQMNKPIPLADAMHILENMNLKVMTEKSFEVKTNTRHTVWVSDFEMKYVTGNEINIDDLGEKFQDSFRKIWNGEAENDKFNAMIIDASLDWFQISMLRAYARYFRQIGFNFSENYIQQTLLNNTVILKKIVAMFEIRFDPANEDTAAQQVQLLHEDILNDLEKIVNIDDDRIIRKYIEVILATDRTNYFQVNDDGDVKPYLALKLAPHRITEMPLPRPKHETFIYSPRFEGLHLRFDSVARGGIRWSDRQEDFRTEVLGLMKAQQVKNSVIVPSGSKGVFVPKCISADLSRQEQNDEGIYCYKLFISGLLDITDNLIDSEVIKPNNILCHDGDDSYLVVAADKGTATFSDTANEISRQYGYWLKDAFASGGSIGYDHKKMGITARGCWESVKRHFLEIDIDINKPFSVVGIGDMSGDVFGNGMLLSNKIKLIAAFNHKHIFLDPCPNTEKSFHERKRLFEMPGSGWCDYNSKLISKGGDIYSRSAKYINITPEVADLFDISDARLRPDELIRKLLKAQVDLLWNGGIGTYVKSVKETDVNVGDRGNDMLRIDGCDLRARVIAEGGNLGLTQLGRVEYELAGGRVNTDFIDNSSGVNCSDHEVNIKILLNQMVDSGDMTFKHRNKLLEEMTDEVAKLVLYDSFKTNIAISLAVKQMHESAGLLLRFMEKQEAAGKINLEVEFLPDKSTLTKRNTIGHFLTRPELSVLFSYSKIIMRAEILQGDFMNDDVMIDFVLKAFPSKISNKYTESLKSHYLYKEIAATILCNQFVLEMGITFVQQLHDELGANACDIVKSYIAAREILCIEDIIADVDNNYAKIPANLYLDILVTFRVIIRRITRWLLRNKKIVNVTDTIEYYGNDAKLLLKNIPVLIDGSDKKEFTQVKQKMLNAGLSEALSKKIAVFHIAAPILNVIESSKEGVADVELFALVYFKLSDKLGISWLRKCINDYDVKSRWDIVARVSAQSDLDRHQRAITSTIIKLNHDLNNQNLSPEKQISYWLTQNKVSVDRWLSNLAEVHALKSLDFAVVSVIIRELFELAYLT
ncbi:MAG: NAD-glutamate dehydrogenase [Legionellales bacterium]|nr:NAD-glutamate dehydrogenase [Legionellales bacterium]